MGRLGTLWRRCRRRPLLSGLAASLVLAVVAGIAGVTWQWRRAEFQRRRAVDALQHGSNALAALLPLFDPRRRCRGSVSPGTRGAFHAASSNTIGTPFSINFAPTRNYAAPCLSMTMSVMGLLQRTAPIDEALRAWQEARLSFEGLLRDDPTNLVARDLPPVVSEPRGRCLWRRGKSKRAPFGYDQANNQWQAFVAMKENEPAADTGYRSGREAWAAYLIDLASVELRLGRKAEVLGSLRQALGLAKGLFREQPGSEPARRLLVRVCSLLAVQVREDRPGEAISLWRQAERLDRADRDRKPYGLRRPGAARHDLYWLGGLEDRLDLVDKALADFRRAAAIFERTVASEAGYTFMRCELGTSYHVIGRLLADSGRSSDAIASYRSAIEHRERLVRDHPEDVRWRSDCAGSWFRLGEAQEKLGRIAAAVEAYQKSVVYQRQVYAREPGEIKHRTFLDERLRRLFWLLIALGRPAEAVNMAREGSALSSGKLAASLPLKGVGSQ